jgi:alpha-beta hydrolase superfamily lysophospholipase
MFLGAHRVADPVQVAGMRSDLPVYIAVGEADPVNGGLALLTPLTDRYAAAGLTDVTVRTYPGARHEVLNETNRDEIFDELISWINHLLASSREGS